ncbi:carboxymuconolactone decarboxylase family protein [Embleya hyalina]|uniref:Alkyl hydroperoxide reductase AhpD n=1 Tax=Embleya hyalina TaxID=516124 RepID=A0A401YLG7_9ACTN|nr:carboxymuconolactone decarboxylase family protein [Embleya hyalina]GCD95427.1 alkyl hydroperoxide reductase AhpD [Embleya hyalina]
MSIQEVTAETPVAGEPARLPVESLHGAAYKAAIALSTVAAEGLDPIVAELIKIRASQINGCAYCVDMHTKDARELGETEQRMHAIPVWRETPFFTARERAVLALTEAVTLLTEGHVPTPVWDEAAKYFDDVEMGRIVWSIAAINTLNRVGVATRAWVVGSYRPDLAR